MGPGETIGEFAVERAAGAGGMGTVYRAVDTRSGAAVALKVLHGQDPKEAERFTREVATLAALVHPGIVRYVAHGRTPDGKLYLVTEWCEGEDLDHRLHHSGLTVAQSVLLVRRVAEALAVAHAKGIVHRDIKPSNLFLPGGTIDQVKLLDFGIARMSRAERAVTRTGALVGTPGYMAPEQATGGRVLDARADVFSLGCVLYECLTGRAAFAGEHVLAVLAKILVEEPPSLRELRPEVPPALEELVQRMLAKSPEQRPADAAAVAEALVALDRLPESGAAPAAAPSVALTGTEQRVLSVLLAGDASAVGPTWSPQESIAIDTSVREIVARHDGRFDRLADGSLLALISGTGAATDQAARAARCAIELRPLLGALPMVLATGRGVIASRYPAGEVIDRAVAILRKARPGELRLDEPTASLLGGRFDVERDDAGPRLGGAREAFEIPRTVLGKPTPCVGRERERDVLTALWTDCVEEPMARAVLVTGPAGAGKSRLAHEFVSRATPQILVGRGDPVRAGSPFAMIAEAVRRAAGVLEGAPPEERRTKLRARLAQRLSGRALDHTFAFLGELSGVPIVDSDDPAVPSARRDPMLMGDAMRTAWEEWLRAECDAAPVLLVLEDLQWGDLPTVNFVDAALRNLHDRPLMVLALARPEVHNEFPALWSDRPVQEVRLEKLPKRACEKLCRAVLGEEAAPAAVAAAVERADGNPFYLEELIRVIAEGGDTSELPESVLGMLQARLDALGPEARRVLRAASVFGSACWRGGVVALLGGAPRTRDAGNWLDYLVERDVLARRAAASLPGEVEYAFRNALLREAAYAMLTDADRRLGHRLAGEWLERVGAGDAITLAEHYQRAGEPERAIGFYHRAAAQALEGNDLGLAISCAQRGLDAGAEGTLRGGLELVQAEAMIWRGELGTAAATAGRATEHLGAGTSAWFRATEVVVTARGFEGNHGEVARWAETMRAVTPAAAADVSAKVMSLCRAGAALVGGGRYADVDLVLADVEALFAGPVPLDALASALVWDLRAKRHHHAGRPGACVDAYRQALALARESGHIRQRCVSGAMLAFGLQEVGLWEEDEALVRASMDEAARWGLHFIEPWACVLAGNALHQLGRHEEAPGFLDRSIMAGAVFGDARLEGIARVYRATAALEIGDLDTAEEEAKRAAELLTTQPPQRPAALGVLAATLVARGRPTEAIAHAADALAQIEAMGGVDEGEIRVHLALVEAHEARGDLDGARRAAAAGVARVEARAASIADTQTRRAFLTRVPENARLRARAAALGAGAGA